MNNLNISFVKYNIKQINTIDKLTQYTDLFHADTVIP